MGALCLPGLWAASLAKQLAGAMTVMTVVTVMTVMRRSWAKIHRL